MSVDISDLSPVIEPDIQSGVSLIEISKILINYYFFESFSWLFQIDYLEENDIKMVSLCLLYFLLIY